MPIKEYNSNLIRRDSNMELLRIITMSMIVILHLSVFLLDDNSHFWVKEIKSLTIVSVNVFIMLSGWYGIKFKWQRFFGLWFQILFWSIIGLFWGGINNIDISLSHIISCLFLTTGKEYGFFQSYIILYIFSPLINKYVDITPKNDIYKFLAVFFVIQLIWGCLSWGYVYFGNGYSCISFMGIYLFARFARVHEIAKNLSSLQWAISYLLFSLLGSTLAFTLYSRQGTLSFWGQSLAYSYASPFVILSAFSFLKVFSKIELRHSLIINFISRHSFAVYLLHMNSFMLPFFLNLCKPYISHNIMQFIPLAIASCFTVFIISIVLDSIRLVMWNKILFVYNLLLSNEKDLLSNR